MRVGGIGVCKRGCRSEGVVIEKMRPWWGLEPVRDGRIGEGIRVRGLSIAVRRWGWRGWVVVQIKVLWGSSYMI